MSKDVEGVAANIRRFADRFRSAGQVDFERQARRIAEAVLLADDIEIAESIRALLVRRWVSYAALPVVGASAGEYDSSGSADDAATYLDQSAAPDGSQAIGQCATFVSDAIQDAGIDIQPIGDFDNGLGYACDMGASLEAAGFEPVYGGPVSSSETYQPQVGDVAVIQPYDGQDPPAGHACMWTGNEWVSDYHQGNQMYAYPQNVSQQTPYVIYRWPTSK